MNSQPENRPSFGEFLERLAGKTIAIVYSYSNVVDREATWYDRWRSDVVSYYGLAVEALRAEARYLDIDTYLRLMSEPKAFVGDVIINLHSGLNQIGSWPIISSLASWRGLPIVPCSSDVHITSERKDIANTVARTTRLNVPADWTSESGMEKRFILKPRDLGMSKGILVTSDRSLIENRLSAATYICQEFVRGYDATIAMVFTPDHSYMVLGGMIYLPDTPSPHDWILKTGAKDQLNPTGEHARNQIPVGSSLAHELTMLAERLGHSSVFRMDFRVDPDENGQPPSSLTLASTHFLEANPTPTISENSSFGELVSLAMDNREQAERLTQGKLEQLSKKVRAQAALVAAQLYASGA
ncbi:MAG: hypothetical protein O7I42_20445 [Alphaproteobacteria bacterium]|nr:hypothetical protein [Alphaproteobacteria bacterium]